MGGLEPGDKALNFELKNANIIDGKILISLDDIMGENGAVVLFECNHCPYVVGSIDRINNVAKFALENKLGFVGVNSNDAINYPDDSFEAMQKRAMKGMPYSYLHDEDQQVAKEWGAERTPEFYLINSNKIVVYRGRMDDSPKNPTNATTSELLDAIKSLLSDESPITTRTDSIGCSIKWKV